MSLQANTITIRAEKAKDGDRRVRPVSQRLKGVLAMVRHDPEGKSTPLPPSSSTTPSARKSPTRRSAGPGGTLATLDTRILNSSRGIEIEWRSTTSLGCARKPRLSRAAG